MSGRVWFFGVAGSVAAGLLLAVRAARRKHLEREHHILTAEHAPYLPEQRSAFLVEEMPGDQVTREMVDDDGGYWLHQPMVTFATGRARRIRAVQLLDRDTTGPTFHPVAERAL